MTNESKKEPKDIATSSELKAKLLAIIAALEAIPAEKNFSDAQWQQLLLRKQELTQQAEQDAHKPIPILRKQSRQSSRDIKQVDIELGQTLVRYDEDKIVEEKRQAAERKMRFSKILEGLKDAQLKQALQSPAATVIDEMVQLFQVDIPAHFGTMAKRKAAVGADELVDYLDTMIRELVVKKETSRALLGNYSALLMRVINRIMPSDENPGETGYVLVTFYSIFSRNANPLQWDVLKEQVGDFLQFTQGSWASNYAIFSEQLLALGKLLATARGEEDITRLSQHMGFLAFILQDSNYSLEQLKKYAQILFNINMNFGSQQLSHEVNSVFDYLSTAIEDEIKRRENDDFLHFEIDEDTKEVIQNLCAPLPEEYHQLMKLIREARDHGNTHSNSIVAETLLTLTSHLHVRAFAFYKNNHPRDEEKNQFRKDIKDMINNARPVLIEHRATAAIRLLTRIRALFCMIVHAVRYGIFGSYNRTIDDYAHRRTTSRAKTLAISDFVEKAVQKPAKRKALKRRNY